MSARVSGSGSVRRSEVGRGLVALGAAGVLAGGGLLVPGGSAWGLPAGWAPGGGGAASRPVAAGGDVPVPTPPVPSGLSAGIEDPAPYVKQVSCDPVAKPGAQALARLLTGTYPATTAGITRSCGADGIASEHYEGRAIDWMASIRNPTTSLQAQAVINWLLASDAAGHPFANARRLGVMYLIWNGRIWGSYASTAGWRPYSTCASHPEPALDTTCHRDHVHISLSWAGAMGRTSFWTKQVAATDYGPCRPADLNWAAPRSGVNATPCPSYPLLTAPPGANSTTAALVRFSGALIGPGADGPAVASLQAALGVTADAQFGPDTATAVAGFRSTHGLGAGSLVDAATWRALLRADGVPVHPEPTGTDDPSRTSPGQRQPSRPSRDALARYAGTVLRYGARGDAVLAVQRVLGVSPLSGWFGPVTLAAVQRFQTAHRLPSTGVVDAATWRALAA